MKFIIIYITHPNMKEAKKVTEAPPLPLGL